MFRLFVFVSLFAGCIDDPFNYVSQTGDAQLEIAETARPDSYDTSLPEATVGPTEVSSEVSEVTPEVSEVLSDTEAFVPDTITACYPIPPSCQRHNATWDSSQQRDELNLTGDSNLLEWMPEHDMGLAHMYAFSDTVGTFRGFSDLRGQIQLSPTEIAIRITFNGESHLIQGPFQWSDDPYSYEVWESTIDIDPKCSEWAWGNHIKYQVVAGGMILKLDIPYQRLGVVLLSGQEEMAPNTHVYFHFTFEAGCWDPYGE